MPESSSFGSRLILVVDDERTITDTLVLILNHSDQKLFSIGSTDLSEALTIIRGIQPDLVLLDVKMPGAIGLGHAIEIRNKGGFKVLLMSGDPATGDHLEAYLATGGEPFEILAKPVQPTHLIAKIQEILNERPSSEWKNPLMSQLQ